MKTRLIAKVRMEIWYLLEQRWWAMTNPFWKEEASDPPLASVGCFFYVKYHHALRDIHRLAEAK